MPLDKGHLAELYKASEYEHSSFDKNLLYIASGALGLSFTFIEKIVPLKDACDKGILLWAWSLFTFTILLSLIAHYISALVNENVIRNYSEFNKPEGIKNVKNFNCLLNTLNIATIVSLITGLSLLIVFVGLNIT